MIFISYNVYSPIPEMQEPLGWNLTAVLHQHQITAGKVEVKTKNAGGRWVGG